MSEKRQPVTVEHLLHLSIFLLALGTRLIRLGEGALSDFEAAAALPAWGAAEGLPSMALGSQPGYVILTWLLFFVFDSTEFYARFWPALAGGLLAWLPFLFRRQVGRRAALVLGVGLALDPGLVGASRMASGLMLGLPFGFLAAAFFWFGWEQRDRLKLAAGGIFLGIALLSGPAFFTGLLAFGLSFFALRAFGLWRGLGVYFRQAEGHSVPENSDGVSEGELRRTAGIAFIATLLLAGSLFLRFPQGIGALGETLFAYFRSWAEPSGVPAGRLLIALLAYQGLVLVLAGFSAWRAWRNGEILGQALSLVALSCLAIVLLYPARQVIDLTWALVPLWVLAAQNLVRFSLGQGIGRVVSASLSGILLILASSVWVNLASLSNTRPDQQSVVLNIFNQPLTLDQYYLNFLVILGAVVLMGLSVGTVGVWDQQAAMRGLRWGAGLVIVIGMLGGNWGVSNRRPHEMRELWYPSPLAGQLGLIRETVSELGSWSVGHAAGLDITLAVDSPSIRWALRDQENLRLVDRIVFEERPSIIIAEESREDLRLSSSYRGQTFSYRVLPFWDGLGMPQWLSWWVFRDAPAVQENVILWGEAGLFHAQETLISGDGVPESEPAEDDGIQ